MAVITIDIDTGGTFTDSFVVRDGVARTVKTLTTPHDLAVCFRNVIEGAADELGTTVADMLRDTVSVRYATTVGTNTVLQRRGPRLGLLTDRETVSASVRSGIGLFVAPEMVATVPAGGDAQARTESLSAVRTLLRDGARGLVVACSEAAGTNDPSGEDSLADTFAEHYPKHCLDSVPLLRTGEICADPDQHRRIATALFNAYVHPEVADFLYRAEDYLRAQGYHRPLRIVHNDGGAARVARTVAAKTYNSGPMAGLLGARAVAAHYGLGDLVTLDMGGTSLDVGIVRNGEVPMRRHGQIEDIEIAFSLPDLVPLGVGGGSIAWLDGADLRVGPRSAGATPGPACFGFGGDAPTVTDADVVVGVLRPDAFLGGNMEISVSAAAQAFEPLAEALGVGVVEAAEQVLARVHRDSGERLAAELRARGIDPKTVTALGFGGNGATHGAAIAAAAGIDNLLILPFAPVFSAFGASTVDIRYRHEARAQSATEDDLSTRALRDMRGEGVDAGDVELTVDRFERDGVGWIAVEANHTLPHLDLARIEPPAAAAISAQVSEPVRWPGHGELDTVVVERARLRVEETLAGPALVDAPETTCAVPPGWSVVMDALGTLRLSASTRSDNDEY
ncbi:hydantoinase/oxoprolinase family protein [Nocardia flavorosea]|uniref:hydantoinase/oxoprolinase family protein n=1 Tax=Nocardia flavorosea TaxID=53429 RepID=UPI0018939192|nr:hydantoinase/oxoprolinase family protein [Nocardia flavorosea]MBF6350163.1 hydantoinase/oxoprolinase family protein [Nocardia flavorosea]